MMHPLLTAAAGLLIALAPALSAAKHGPATDTLAVAPVQDTTKVVISCEENLEQGHVDYYYSHLLRLALTKTVPTHGAFDVEFVQVMPIDKRLLREMERGSIHVTWMPYARDLEHAVVPIEIPLLKNLSDYRVLLIRLEDMERFAQVKDINDLRQFKGGVGSHWADRWVMERNGLPLVLSVSYHTLFKMLKSKRFDYFSRGVYQVRDELEKRVDGNIGLEQHLFLRYDNPVYFYVHRDNRELANRIETGLKMALADGSFDALFNSIDNLRWGEALLKEGNRTVIYLSVGDQPKGN